MVKSKVVSAIATHRQYAETNKNRGARQKKKKDISLICNDKLLLA